MYYVANNVTQAPASGVSANLSSAEFLCGLLNQVTPDAYVVKGTPLDEIPHADYPHEPGRLYDCARCESECFCSGDPGETECVFCASLSL